MCECTKEMICSAHLINTIDVTSVTFRVNTAHRQWITSQSYTINDFEQPMFMLKMFIVITTRISQAMVTILSRFLLIQSYHAHFQYYFTQHSSWNKSQRKRKRKENTINFQSSAPRLPTYQLTAELSAWHWCAAHPQSLSLRLHRICCCTD